MRKKEKKFSISARIECSDGSELERQRLLETETGKPDATLSATKSEALNAFTAFIGAFLGSFMREIKEEAAKKNKGEVEKVKFTLSDGENEVKEKTLDKEEIAKITKS